MTTKPPTSLRIPEATRIRVEAWADEQGLPRNAAYVQLIERGLRPDVEVTKAKGKAPAPADLPRAPAVHVAVPKLERKAFNPQPKTTRKK